MLPLQPFIDYIKKNALFSPEEKILLAVSGGKDSVLMAQLFKLAGYQFSIAHCNFNLRGAEAQRDESFVKLLATDLDVPFYCTHFDTKAYADAHQISIQMAARDLRYQWFETIRTKGNYAFIALAHHQNDSIETVLLNLTRGTGISGMHGILPKRARLIRPLLFLSRQQIDELIAENHIDFVSDSSNESIKYARNNIRLNVIPHLREINPNLEETFARNIERFAQIEELLQEIVEVTRTRITRADKQGIYYPLDAIRQLKPRKLLFFELIRPFHFSNLVGDEILQALNKQSGTSFYSATHRATINRKELMISRLDEPPGTGHIFIQPTDHVVKIGQQKINISYQDTNAIAVAANKAFVDFDQLIYPLSMRFKQDGDRFMPFGMQQYKKLSDFLIDQKIPLPQKSSIPLLINGNGEIIWVVGYRQDNRYKVNATTKKVVIFELSNQDGPKT